ncbi:MAG: response regulator [Planctomycetota bacterium]
MPKFRILIVDDETDTLELYLKFLKSDDYDIVTTSSPVKAVELLKNEKWDLLISDIFMPKVDGFELMSIAFKEQPDLRTIAVTGYGTEEVLEKVLKNDCFGYINKPFDWDYLKLLIKKALRRSTRESNKKRRKR